MEKENENKVVLAYKGFDKDLKCRGFAYEVGKTYELPEGENVKICERGFHACENPMDVLNFYPPSVNGNLNRYCQVEQSGDIEDREEKKASSRIHVSCEIGLKGLIEAGVKFILDKVDWKNAKESNTGDQSAATNTGNQSAASVSGKESVAIVTGKGSRAKGALGCWLVLTERDGWDGEAYPIKEVRAVKVDGEVIKADTWYMLINGEFKEVEG